MARRAQRERSRRLDLRVVLAALLVVAIVGAAYAVSAVMQHPLAKRTALAAQAPLPSGSIESADGTAAATASAPAASATAAVEVEVPHVVGKTVKVAAAVLSAVGLSVQTRVADPIKPGVTPDGVTAQWPSAGALVEPGSAVVLTYQPRTSAPSVAAAVVVIDAGHQAKADLANEPIGPGSKTVKPKVAGGATGVATGVPEYERNLQISLKLKALLVAKGVKVVMVRTGNNVDIPNSVRAKIGNDAHADLVVRVHCDSSTDGSVTGISTLFPSGNSWVKSIEASSRAAADAIQASVTKASGAFSRGVFGRSDMSGFNYSTRPTVIVECGFLSNRAEDQKLGKSAYQQQIAKGIADGVMAFLAARS